MSDSFATAWARDRQVPLSLHFPGRNTRVGYHFLLQRIFLTQGSNSHHLHWQVGSLPLSHLGSPWEAPGKPPVTPLGLPCIHLHWTMCLHISYILLHHSFHCLQHYIEINCTWLLSRLYSLRGQYIINALSPRINTAPTHKRDNDNILTDNKFYWNI